MYNKRVLSKAVSELNKTKAPAKPKDIITDPMGQWKYPGQVIRIPSNNITMQGVPYPVWAQPNVGHGMMMQPGQDYDFPGADYVDEYPQMQEGGKADYNLPISYQNALKNFIYPKVINLPEETDNQRYGYDAALGVINQNPNDPVINMNNPWWREHELFHHLQNQAGALSTYGLVGQRPNPYVASDESIGSYYDRRSSEFNTELNKILKKNPDISEEEAYGLAEENLYKNAKSVEGEARDYEGYIDAGNKSIFSRDTTGMTPEENYIEAELTPEEIQSYRDGGYIVEDISLPELQDGGEGAKLNLDLPEQTVYANESKRKLQGSLIDKLSQVKNAYQDYRENAGLTKLRLKNEGVSSMESLKRNIKEYKTQLEEEKKSFDKAQKALNVLQKKDPKTWENKKLKDVMSAQGVDALRSLYKDGKISNESFIDFYNNFGKQFDREAVKTSAEDQVKLEDSWYGKKDKQGRRTWMSNPMNVAKIAQGVAIGAPLAPVAAIAAPAIASGASSLIPAAQTALNASMLGVPGLTANNLLWGAGAYLSADQIIDPKSATRTSINTAIKDPSLYNVVDAAGNVGMTGLGFAGLPVKAGVASLADDITQAGRYITTQTPLKNTYKINPWAFKANPEAYYHRSPNLKNIVNKETKMLQGFGESEAGKIFSQGKDYYPGTKLNLRKPANDQLYFSKEVPLDYGRYNSVKKGMSGQGYEGPYLVEVQNVPMGASTKGRRPTIEPPKGAEKYAVSHRPISLDEAKFYKEDWLKGYKEVPKELPGSPNAVSSVDDVGRSVINKAGFPNNMYDEPVKAGLDGNFITRPLTLFTKNELTNIPGKNMAYRKIGNKSGLQDLINKGGAQAPGPLRMKSGVTIDTPFFGFGKKPTESYKGMYAVEVDPANPKYKWSSRVAGTDNYGSAPFDRNTEQLIKNIPIEDLNVYRKKWFSNNYKKLDPENLEAGLKNADAQYLAENAWKWGIRGAVADQVFNDGEYTKKVKDFLGSYPKKEEGGSTNDYIDTELTPDEIEWYKSQGYIVEELD
jgi:hypothetical protein